MNIDGQPIDAQTLHGAALAPLVLIGIEIGPAADWISGLATTATSA